MDSTVQIAQLVQQVTIANAAAGEMASQVQALHAAIAQQEADTQAAAAQHAQQVAELQNELDAVRRHARVLEDERLSAQEALGKYYSATVLVDKEKLDIERIRTELNAQRRELESARAFFVTQQREAEAAQAALKQAADVRLTAEDLVAFRAQNHELQALLATLEGTLKSRALFEFGAALETAGARASGSLAAAQDSAPSLLYVQELSQLVGHMRSMLAPAPSSTGSVLAAVLATPPPVAVAHQLREQQLALMRLVHHLAVDTEADAAKLMAREAHVSELQTEVARLRADVAQQAGEAAKVPGLQLQLEAATQEAAELRVLFKANNSKAREQMEKLVQQNQVLRQQLVEKHDALAVVRNDASERVGQLAAECAALSAAVSAERKAASSATQQADASAARLSALQAAFEQQAARADELAQHLAQAEGAAHAAAAQAAAVTGELRGVVEILQDERAQRAEVDEAREAQLQDIHEEMRAQLQAVMDAYAAELHALHEQIVRLEAVRAGAAGATLTGVSAGVQAQVLQLRQQLAAAEQQSAQLAAQLAVAKRQLAAMVSGEQREAALQQAARDAMARLTALETHAQQVEGQLREQAGLSANLTAAEARYKRQVEGLQVQLAAATAQLAAATAAAEAAEARAAAAISDAYQRQEEASHLVTHAPVKRRTSWQEAVGLDAGQGSARSGSGGGSGTQPGSGHGSGGGAGGGTGTGGEGATYAHVQRLAEELSSLRSRHEHLKLKYTKQGLRLHALQQVLLALKARGVLDTLPSAPSSPPPSPMLQHTAAPGSRWPPSLAATGHSALVGAMHVGAPPPSSSPRATGAASSGGGLSPVRELPSEPSFGFELSHHRRGGAPAPGSRAGAAAGGTGSTVQGLLSRNSTDASHRAAGQVMGGYSEAAGGGGVGGGPGTQRPHIPTVGRSGGRGTYTDFELNSSLRSESLGSGYASSGLAADDESSEPHPAYHMSKAISDPAGLVVQEVSAHGMLHAERMLDIPSDSDSLSVLSTQVMPAVGAGGAVAGWRAAASSKAGTAGAAQGGRTSMGPPVGQEQGVASGLSVPKPRPAALAVHGGRDGPPAPVEVLQMAAQYAGDEGLARPSSAAPSILRGTGGGDHGPPVPEEVLQLAQQYVGPEGLARPGTAAPSILRASSPREAPVPAAVLQYAQQYTGAEGRARPSSAAPSVLRTSPDSPTAMYPPDGTQVGMGRPQSAVTSDRRGAGTAPGASAGYVQLPNSPLRVTLRSSEEGLHEGEQVSGTSASPTPSHGEGSVTQGGGEGGEGEDTAWAGIHTDGMGDEEEDGGYDGEGREEGEEGGAPWDGVEGGQSEHEQGGEHAREEDDDLSDGVAFHHGRGYMGLMHGEEAGAPDDM